MVVLPTEAKTERSAARQLQRHCKLVEFVAVHKNQHRLWLRSLRETYTYTHVGSICLLVPQVTSGARSGLTDMQVIPSVSLLLPVLQCCQLGLKLSDPIFESLVLVFAIRDPIVESLVQVL